MKLKPFNFFLKTIVVTPSFSKPMAAVKSFFPPQYVSSFGVDLKYDKNTKKRTFKSTSFIRIITDMSYSSISIFQAHLIIN